MTLHSDCCSSMGSVVEHVIALPPHSTRLPGSILSSAYCKSLHVLPMPTWISFEYSGFFSPPKNHASCEWSPAMDRCPIHNTFLPHAQWVGSRLAARQEYNLNWKPVHSRASYTDIFTLRGNFSSPVGTFLGD